MVLRLFRDIIRVSVELNGIILRKAEMERSFNVYPEIFEKLSELEEFEEEDFLSILGNIGG